jgi:hypothetical protein
MGELQMRWLELFKVQVAQGHENEVASRLRALAEDLRSTGDLQGDDPCAAWAFEHDEVPGIFLACLCWKREMPGRPSSAVAARLEQDLREHGLVSCSYWRTLGEVLDGRRR